MPGSHPFDYPFPISRTDLAGFSMEKRLYCIDCLMAAEKLGLIPPPGDFYALGEVDQRVVWGLVAPKMLDRMGSSLRSSIWDYGFPVARKKLALAWFCAQVLGLLVEHIAHSTSHAPTQPLGATIILPLIGLAGFGCLLAMVLDAVLVGWAWITGKHKAKVAP